MTDIPELTDAEKLAALGTYIKVLTEMEQALRADVTKDMGARKVEKVGAYLPDGTKMASVTRSNGRKTARVQDAAAALRWCIKQYPEAIVQAINPAFLKGITDYSAKVGTVGDPGVDPRTGEALDFIEVVQGNPYVSITTTTEGVASMAALAHGFAGMLGAAPQHDPDFADRLENGAYN
jgi:hypothetical protein